MARFDEARAATITLPPSNYDGGLEGWEHLAEAVECQQNVVAMVPDLVCEKVGSIFLPEDAQENRKPDIGTVISSGVEELQAGDRVIYAPWAGHWLTPFVVGRLKVHEMRFYGLVSPGVEDMVVYEPIEDVLPAKSVHGAIVPIGENVLIKRDPMQVQAGSLILDLPDDAKYRTLKATVVAVGPKAMGPKGEKLKEGDRVMYHGASIVLGLKQIGQAEGIAEDLGDYALIKSRNLYCVINE